MPTREARSTAVNEADETAIGNYLRANPDFFVRNEPLLSVLRLPHARGSAAVSLVERQVEVLREKSQNVESRLAEFVATARDNDQLAGKIHHFTRRLMRAGSRDAVIAQLEASLREDFEAFNSTLVLFGGTQDNQGRFVQIVERNDPRLAGFETLLNSGKPRCGQVRDSQREFLFGREVSEVASVALVPLGVGQGAPLGLLAIASPDRDRFHPGMATEFLTRMGELLADALAR